METLTPLFTSQKIQERVLTLGKEITQDYQGKELIVVGVLRGAFMFMSDLVRAINLPLKCEFLRVASYNQDQSSGEIQLIADLSDSIANTHVLIIEDIVDTGLTLKFLMKHLSEKSPQSLKTCSLLYKEVDPQIRPQIDYLGFTIPNHYVIGYGLDSKGLYRSLPYIAIHP